MNRQSSPRRAAALQPVKARPIRLAPHATGIATFRRIIGNCLDQLRQNEPVARAGQEEGIHQARVAIRRLRSALVLFEDHASAKDADRLQAGLRDLARVLGEARDWDVFVGKTIPAFQAACPDRPAAGPAAVAARLRSEAHRRAARVLAKPAQPALLDQIESWAAGEAWCAGLGVHAMRQIGGPIRELAPDLLDRALRRVRKRGKGIAHHSDEERHSLRKAAKKLRYSAEFLGSLYPRKPVHKFLKHLEDLQDVMGNLNDIAATDALLATIAAQEGADAAAIAGMRSWVGGGRDSLLHDLDRSWERFRDAEPFWD